jgi:3',5'-cyclic AMP phosphodiesterase CpdA
VTPVWIGVAHYANQEKEMADRDAKENSGGANISRRRMLKCMSWAGTGVVWTLSGGVPRTLGLIGGAAAAETPAGELTFVQISDSHIGFHLPPNPDPRATLTEAINKIKAMPTQPAFLVHTGDISHLSKQEEWDVADQVIKSANKEVFFLPGEHDVADADNGKAYLERYGKSTKGKGWYSFDMAGVHFIGLINVFNFDPGFKSAGFGKLGDEQLEWLEKDVAGRSASTPIVLMAHLPLWTIYQQWGWGTEDAGRALGSVKRFGSVTVLNGHIHQIIQKVEGNVTFHTAASTAFPQPAPGTAPAPGPMKEVPADELRKYLGIRTVNYVRSKGAPALIDSTLVA